MSIPIVQGERGYGTGAPIGGGSSLELAQEVIGKSHEQYDQIQSEESRQSGSVKRIGVNEQTGRSTREGASSIDRRSTQKANVGFTIKFSIPLTGIIPTSGQNC